MRYSFLLVLTLLGLSTLYSISTDHLAHDASFTFTLKALYREKVAPFYTLTVWYPQLPKKHLHASSFNDTIHTLVFQELAVLEQSMEENGSSATSSYKYIAVDYEVLLIHKHALSIQFRFHYYRGGAHGAQHSRIINYNLTEGRLIQVSELFNNPTSSFTVFSSFCIPYLLTYLEASNEANRKWIEDGAAPKPENYKNWALTKEGFKIFFDEYQVACYAQGAPEVLIPYSKIYKELKAECFLKSLIHAE